MQPYQCLFVTASVYRDQITNMYQLKVIIASVRPGRKGPIVASWITDRAKNHPAFEVEVLDLAAINLPFMDEPAHPRFKTYQHDHTKNWSAIVDAADAFVIVTCEYNYGIPASLKNALDFLYQEWNQKAVGVVSYGGVAAGTRSFQMLKLVCSALKMVPVTESVNIPFFTHFIDANNQFRADEHLDKSASVMLDELEKWTKNLHSMRVNS